LGEWVVDESSSVSIGIDGVVGHHNSLVAKHASESSLAQAIPGIDAEAVLTSLIGLALVTVYSLPSRTTPALPGFLQNP
jgi:hypothetical protein